MSNRVEMPEKGKTYNVHHARKGKFQIKVTSIMGEWINGTITEGHAQLVAAESEDLTVGDEVTLRHSLVISYEEVPNASAD